MQAEQETPETMEEKFDPNTPFGTLIVAVTLCLICSMLVSTAAVTLRPLQEKNRLNKMRKNILIAAGIWEDHYTNSDIARLFEPVETVLVNLPTKTGDDFDPQAGTINGDLDPGTYDQRTAAKAPESSQAIEPQFDIAGLKRRERVSAAYLVKDEQNKLKTVVLPIYGKGLWSTLYGFISLESDLKTVRGITYYEHGETPGLGGEIENPSWTGQWPNTQVRDDAGDPVLNVTKPGNAREHNEVDGISGATITSNGVENMINYWLGDQAFGPFLERLSSENVADNPAE